MSRTSAERIGLGSVWLPPLLLLPVVLWVYRQAALHPAESILGGARVSGVFAWQLWWPFHCLTTGDSFLHTSWQFWPEETFAFLHTPVNEGYGILLQTFLDTWTAINVIHISQAWLAAIAAYFLALRLTRDPVASYVAGLVYAFSYYAVVQRMLGHMGLATIGFLPLLLLAWLAFEAKPDRRNTVLLGLAWLGATLADPYMAWFAAALPLAMLLVWRLARRALPARVALRGGAVLAVCVVGPVLAYLPVVVPSFTEEIAGAFRYQSPPLPALFDPPFWHPSGLVQGIRRYTSGVWGFGSDVGELQLYLGLSVLLLLVLGAWRGWLRGAGMWVYLVLLPCLLALGPWLRIRGGDADPLPVPMPYLPLTWLPGLSLFRSTNRAVVTATLAAAVLAAYAMAGWRRDLAASGRRGAAVLRWAVPVAFLCVWGWDMALWRVGGFGTGPIAPSPHYDTLAAAAEGALLELPVTFNEDGYQSLNAHAFLLHQSYHRRPLVLGFPSRYPKRVLARFERPGLLYVLTHPDRLADALARDPNPPWLADLREAPETRRFAREVRFVLLHTRDPILRGKFTEREVQGLRRVLEAALGPAEDDGRGNLLWINGASASPAARENSS